MPEMMNVAMVKAPQRALVKSWKVREPTMYSAPVGKDCSLLKFSVGGVGVFTILRPCGD